MQQQRKLLNILEFLLTAHEVLGHEIEDISDRSSDGEKSDGDDYHREDERASSHEQCDVFGAAMEEDGALALEVENDIDGTETNPKLDMSWNLNLYNCKGTKANTFSRKLQ